MDSRDAQQYLDQREIDLDFDDMMDQQVVDLDLKVKGQVQNSLSDTFGSRQNREMKVNMDDIMSIGSSYDFRFKEDAIKRKT